MEHQFWHKCWQRNTIGFHQQQIHPFLERYLLPELKATATNVFVPLCGKSLDMAWLAERMNVIGAELSDIACQDFFNENNVDFTVQNKAPFNIYSDKNNRLSLYQGDFFKLTAAQLPVFDWIYDRAALVAMPPPLQQEYVDHLLTFLTKQTSLFLISVELPQNEHVGPPFNITHSTVEQLFKGCEIKCIADAELIDKQFAQRTLPVSYLREKAYIISKE